MDSRRRLPPLPPSLCCKPGIAIAGKETAGKVRGEIKGVDPYAERSCRDLEVDTWSAHGCIRLKHPSWRKKNNTKTEKGH